MAESAPPVMSDPKAYPDVAAPDTSPQASQRWCLGTRAVVAATAAWTVFVVAHVALTGRWWVWTTVEAVPPVTLVVVPALLLVVAPLARPVRRRLCLFLLALLLVGVSLAGFNPGALLAGRPTSTGLKIIAWNTDRWHMEEDQRRFFAYLRAQRADVYLLQEYLYWKDGPVRIDDAAKLKAALPGYRVVAEGELVIITRLPVLMTHPRRVGSAGTDWYWRGSKAQRADLRVNGQVLSIYNVHNHVPFRFERSPFSRSFYSFVREQHARQQAELEALRADMARNPHPILVVGDFNSPWMGTLRHPGGDLRVHHPTDSVFPRSWPTADYPFPRLWRLDWAYTNSRVEVNRYRFVPSVSDHLAQELHISLPPRKAVTL